jgi:choline-sulfatase
LLELFKDSTNSDRGVVSESRYAHYHFGAATLRSLRIGNWKFIEAPTPEVYDLARDPAEATNLYVAQSTLAAAFREKLAQYLARYKPARAPHEDAIAPEVAAKLRSLGYVVYSSKQNVPSDSGPDPKELLPDYKAFERALALSSSGSMLKADMLLAGLLSKNPAVIDARMTLGLNEQKLGKQQDAAQQFQLVLRQEPLNVLAHYNLAVSYAALQEVSGARKEFETTLTLAPDHTHAEDLLGRILIEQGNYENAERCYEHVLRVSPGDYEANYNLGVLAARNQQWDTALRDLKEAVRAEPASAEGHNALGGVCLKKGWSEKARKEFDEAIRLNPRFGSAHFNVGLILRDEGRLPEAAQEFRTALSIDPAFEAARTALRQLPHTE